MKFVSTCVPDATPAFRIRRTILRSSLDTDSFLDLWERNFPGRHFHRHVFAVKSSVALLVGGHRRHEYHARQRDGAERVKSVCAKAIGARREQYTDAISAGSRDSVECRRSARGAPWPRLLALSVRLIFPSLPVSVVSLTLVVVGVSAAGLIGVFFGVYPAWKAAGLESGGCTFATSEGEGRGVRCECARGTPTARRPGSPLFCLRSLWMKPENVRPTNQSFLE